MAHSQQTPCTAFEGARRIACGELQHVATEVKKAAVHGPREALLIFEDETGEVIDLDFRGFPAGPTPAPAEAPRLPGRPKLGVVGREVTLLPRHWEWLGQQPGGASVALRKLVEEARRANAGRDRVRQSQEAAYRFLTALAGNEPGYEEATRALFAGNRGLFQQHTKPWPADIRDYAERLAAAAFAGGSLVPAG